jgi:hypothetical protein
LQPSWCPLFCSNSLLATGNWYSAHNRIR